MSQGLLRVGEKGGDLYLSSSSSQPFRRRFRHDSQGVVSTTRRIFTGFFLNLRFSFFCRSAVGVSVESEWARERSVKCVCNIFLSDWGFSLSRISWTLTYRFFLFLVCDKFLFFSTVLYLSFWRVLKKSNFAILLI